MFFATSEKTGNDSDLKASAQKIIEYFRPEEKYFLLEKCVQVRYLKNRTRLLIPLGMHFVFVLFKSTMAYHRFKKKNK